MNTIGIVIVTYNSESVIGECLDAVLKHPRVHVVVVDNSSSDGTIAEVRKRTEARLIANAGNRGFAAANNQGFAALSDPLILMLNPDATLLDGLEAMATAIQVQGVGAVGGKLVDVRGAVQKGFCVRRFPQALTLVFELLGINRMLPGNPMNRRYRCLDLDLDQEQDVEQPAGAFFLVKRSVWEQVGGLDEGFYPLWFEDVDFTKQILHAGYRIRYVPEGIARHEGGHSALALQWEWRQLYWYANLLRFCSRWFGRPGLVAVSGAVLVGSLLRSVAGMLMLRSLKPIGVYGKVVALVCRCVAAAKTGRLSVSPVKPTGTTAG
jgi:N-acetylglucosaminyl-diphospho-decaprenol L-rhamnosyltransferase